MFVNLTTFFSLLQSGKWNGLMGELVAKKFDMVLTSLKVNAEREAAVDFTSPFLESGTTILVAKRTGIISPTAFLGKTILGLIGCPKLPLDNGAERPALSAYKNGLFLVE